MSWTTVADLAGLVCLLLGAALCLVAGIGLLRFPDLLTRMHAGTKPQVLGVLLVILGVGLRTRSGLDVGMLVLIGVFQLLTIPAGAHMVGRAGFRTGQVALADIHLGSRGRQLQPGAEPPGGQQPGGHQGGHQGGQPGEQHPDGRRER